MRLPALFIFLFTLSTIHAEKPNVLMLLVDDLKPAMGAYGDPTAQTPNLDALAARGMRFDLAFCNQAVCAPSRFTLMLGSHSTSTGLYGLGSHLRQVVPNAVTLPQYFARHGGYRTESLGKVFHIGHGNNGDPASFSVPHFHDKVIEYLDPASTQGGQLTREEAYFTNQQLGAINALPRGAAFESPDVADHAYADGRVANETIKRLHAAKKRGKENNTPFFITAGFARPHLPFSAPKKYWDLYDPEKLPLPEFEEHPANAPRAARKQGGEICNYFPVPDHGDYRAGKEISLKLKRDLIHGYYASTSYVDAQIGKVIDELDRLDLAENTIVVLWGDHGFHLGDLGIWTKHTNYEQANRIPLLIVAPGVTKAGSSTKQLAESVDLYPTLAELAGLPAPKGPQPIDGRSLVPVLKDPSVRVRDHAYHAYPTQKLGRAIRTERHRMVQWGRGDAAEYELYDYQRDPLERENLAEEQPEVLKKLQAILATYPEPVSKNRPKASAPAPVPVGASPHIARLPLEITAEVQTKDPHGVVISQGGIEHGYALHFIDGKAAFDVRINGTVTRQLAGKKSQGVIRLVARLNSAAMELMVDGESQGRIPSPGLIPVQPKDPMSVGHDAHTAAGDYEAPNPFKGSILSTRVKAEGQPPVVVEPQKLSKAKPASWRYTFERPAEGWEKPGFDDRNWQQGIGGFGTHGTPGVRVNTEWSTKEIWLRRTVAFDKAPARPTLLVCHDEDAKIYLNGKQVASLEGFVSEYKTVPVAGAPVKAGKTLVAVHCRQTLGGQGIDVHLGSAAEMERLKRAPNASPKVTMRTPWAEQLTPENAWTEYPRPALQRPDWINLNGLWNYSVAPASSGQPGKWSGKILVPFALEAPLSGVDRLLEPDEALWYERAFEMEAAPSGRLLLHFEAVDYHATVWINGEQVGENTGGNLPFSFDITDQVKAGANIVRLKVVDRTNAPGSYQLTGKQRLKNRGIFYTRVSGIWQTVWMESVSASHIRNLKIRTALDGKISITPDIAGEGALRTEVYLQGRKVAEGGAEVTVPDPKLWSPDSPTLYELVVSLIDPGGEVLDTVKSYAGIREVGKVKDEKGQWRFTLNGKPIFHWGPLDQGWWPDGLLTPPSEEAMLYELDYLKKAGFNMIRKHIKIEPRRYYYHCDRMGFLVWQDQVSGGPKPKWYRLDPAENKGHDVPEPGDPIDAEWPDPDHRQWMAELKGMIDHLGSHPSIVSWVPFNEAWGQHRTKAVGQWIVGYDPTRLINIASGGNFTPVGDIADMHSYPEPAFPFHIPHYDDYVKVVGEFGGHGWAVADHQWDPNKKVFIYGDMPRSLGAYRARYEASVQALAELKKQGVAAGVYTQTTDVEGEINGLITYDRKVQKIPPEQLAEMHRKAGLIE